jgi:hypothetical protein
MPVPAPFISPLAPATLPAPSAPVTIQVVPFIPPRVTPKPSLDDMAMRNLCSPPAAEPLTEWPRSGPGRISNQAFSCKFPRYATNSPNHTKYLCDLEVTELAQHRWLAEAHWRGYNTGQVCNAVSLGDMIPTSIFTTMLHDHFLNLPPVLLGWPWACTLDLRPCSAPYPT